MIYMFCHCLLNGNQFVKMQRITKNTCVAFRLGSAAPGAWEVKMNKNLNLKKMHNLISCISE